MYNSKGKITFDLNLRNIQITRKNTNHKHL